MAKHRVHAVAITDAERGRPVRVISDQDVVAAIANREQPATAQAAATEPVAVSSEERLERAAELMAEHGVAHVVVVDAASGFPTGVLDA